MNYHAQSTRLTTNRAGRFVRLHGPHGMAKPKLAVAPSVAQLLVLGHLAKLSSRRAPVLLRVVLLGNPGSQ